MKSRPLLLLMLASCGLLAPKPLPAAEPAIVFPSSGPVFITGFATEIALSEDTLVVGRPGGVVDDVATGAAHVYARNAGAWQEIATLQAQDGALGNAFGADVAMDAGIIAVGAPNATVDGIVEAGAVYVYLHDGNQWVSAAKLRAEDPTTMAWFGRNIAIDAGRIIVGAPGADQELGEPPGAAYIFAPDGDGQWQQQAKLRVQEPVTNAAFGSAVDISGNTAVVARSVENAVYLYDRGAGSWQLSDVLRPGYKTDPGVGSRVELEGDTLAVSASIDTTAEFPYWWIGLVYVYERDADGWSIAAELSTENPDPLDYFGTKLAMKDGYIAATEGWEASPELHVFKRNATGAWTSIFSGPTFEAFEGRGLAVTGDWLAVGDPMMTAAVPGQEAPQGIVHLFAMTALDTAAFDDVEDDAPADSDGGGDDGTAAGNSNGNSAGGDANPDGDASGGSDAAATAGGTAGETVSADAGGGGAMSWLFAFLLILSKARAILRATVRAL